MGKVYCISINAFSSFIEKLKYSIINLKGVLSEIIRKIETFVRTLFTKQEQLYLDLFLLIYYALGKSAIDVCLLSRNQIKGVLIFK